MAGPTTREMIVQALKSNGGSGSLSFLYKYLASNFPKVKSMPDYQHGVRRSVHEMTKRGELQHTGKATYRLSKR